MAVETGTIISDFDIAKPAGTEPKSILDDQIKWVKSALLATFANITGAVTATHTDLNKVGVTQSPGNNTTAPASTAFVQAAIASVNAQTPLTDTTVATLNPTLVKGVWHDLTYTASANAPKLPASASAGDTLYVRFSNSYYTNSLDRNGLTILNSATDLTNIPPNIWILVRYNGSTWGV